MRTFTDNCMLSLHFNSLSFYYSQKAVRVTTLMKRLRASEQGDSGASGLAAGAAADPNTPGGTPAPPASNSMAASIKAALSEKAPDTQTATISTALSLPSTAVKEEQPQTRCNGDVPQMLPQRKED